MAHHDILLWVAAVAGAVWALGPPLLHALGLHWLHYVAQEDAGAALPQGDDADYERCYSELQSLGFLPLGTVTETRWIMPIEWHRAFRLRCLISGDGLCYASLYRLTEQEPIRVSLKTFLTGAGMVTTVTPGAGIPDIGATRARIEMKAAAIPDLYSHHQDNVKLFAEQRGMSVSRVSFQERADRDEDADRELLRKIETAQMYLLPAFCFLGPCFLALALLHDHFSRFPLSRLLPWALCFATLCYLAFVKIVLPSQVQKECLRSHEPEAGNGASG